MPSSYNAGPQWAAFSILLFQKTNTSKSDQCNEFGTGIRISATCVSRCIHNSAAQLSCTPD